MMKVALPTQPTVIAQAQTRFGDPTRLVYVPGKPATGPGAALIWEIAHANSFGERGFHPAACDALDENDLRHALIMELWQRGEAAGVVEQAVKAFGAMLSSGEQLAPSADHVRSELVVAAFGMVAQIEERLDPENWSIAERILVATAHRYRDALAKAPK